MKHRKKNLTLAKTLSVQKLNCALQRKSQLIGSCALTRKVQNCVTVKAHHGCSYCLKHWHFESSQGSNTKVTPKSLGPSKKNLHRSNANKNQFIWWAMMEIRNIDIDGRKIITLQISNKTTLQKHSFRSEKPLSSLIEVYGQIISSGVHSHEANEGKEIQNNYHLTCW